MPVPEESVEKLDLVIIGGCGHVGLPLALSFADQGLRVGVYDVNEATIAEVRAGHMPFMETGADELLQRLLPTGRLVFDSRAEMVSRSDTIVLVIGTPIDEFMNASTRIFQNVIDEIAPHLRDGALVVLRSTVYPGVTEFVELSLQSHGVDADVVFCPERIAEGRALEEIRSLPQIIGASTDAGYDRAVALFTHLDVEMVRTTPKEAELAKLFTNAWRYLKFAIANQFFEIAHSAGQDYDRILHAIRHHYPRASDLAGPGFAAGPCLLKDTMQLAAFSPDHFPMGHSAMLINEGLPGYIMDAIERRGPLAGRTLGILGMAFKGESDDTRTSLSYKIKKLAAFRGARVLCTDPYVREPGLKPLDEVLAESDVLVVAAPHRAYHGLTVEGAEVIDVWNVLGQGTKV